MKNNTVTAPAAPATFPIDPAAPIGISRYDGQAIEFLTKHGIAFRATLAKVQKAPKWADDGSEHGFQYRVTLSRKTRPGGVNAVHASPLSFPFWDSVAAKENGEILSAYSVLACISGDVHCPSAFADFCAEYGYDEDSRAAHATFKRCATFARKLRAFFEKDEIEGLSEIQ